MPKLNGIICINKPKDFTSFDVVAKARGILQTRKIGHAGTLDPMATGVLPLFVGAATKACDILPDSDKTYIAGFRLGVSTDTQDITGRILSEKLVKIPRTALEEVLAKFRGSILQIPPMFSAVQVGGQRLYNLARQGVEIERKPRSITISAISIFDYDSETSEGFLEISCSKGTYVRTLINDIGEKLLVGGVMTSLIRTRASGFSLNDCLTFEELERSTDLSKFVHSPEKVFMDLPKIMLDDVQTKLYRNGVKLDTARLSGDISPAERYQVWGENVFIGTAKILSGDLIIEKNFYNR